MNQLLQHDVEVRTPTAADPEAGATSRPRKEGRASIEHSPEPSAQSEPQGEEPHSNGHTQVTRTPEILPPPIRPRKKPRLWGIVCVVGLLLIMAIWQLIRPNADIPSPAAMRRELQVSKEAVTQLQARYQQATSTLQAVQLELNQVQDDLRVANQKRRLQDKGRAEQPAQWSKLNERLSQALQTLIQSNTMTLSQHHERFILGLETTILFGPGQFDLRAGGRQTLDKITAVLREFPTYGLQIEWHTHLDETKNPNLDRWAAAWRVAALQAASTAFHLTAQGLTSERLSIVGSFLYPFSSPNNTRNRDVKRQHVVEITLHPFNS